VRKGSYWNFFCSDAEGHHAFSWVTCFFQWEGSCVLLRGFELVMSKAHPPQSGLVLHIFTLDKPVLS
jgi:hypothetical protein